MSSHVAGPKQRVIRPPNRISRQCQIDALWVPDTPGFCLSAWGAKGIGMRLSLSAKELRALVEVAQDALGEIEEGTPR